MRLQKKDFLDKKSFLFNEDMHKLSNDIINLSLEKNTINTPTKGIYYLFKDGKIIDQGNFNKLKLIFDRIINENKTVIEKATKEFREKPLDNKIMFKNWMNMGSNLSFFGGKPKRPEAEKLDKK